jgi:hypothetical protein
MALSLSLQDYININFPQFGSGTGYQIIDTQCTGTDDAKLQVVLYNPAPSEQFETTTIFVPDPEGVCAPAAAPNERDLSTPIEPISTPSPSYKIEIRTIVDGVLYKTSLLPDQRTPNPNSLIRSENLASLVFTKQSNQSGDAGEQLFGQKIAPTTYSFEPSGIPYWSIPRGSNVEIQAFVEEALKISPFKVRNVRWETDSSTPDYPELNLGSDILSREVIKFVMKPADLILNVYFNLPIPEPTLEKSIPKLPNPNPDKSTI